MSTPILGSFSCPRISWQPAQPYLVISFDPSSASRANSSDDGSGKRCSASAGPSLSVSRKETMSAASWSDRRRLGMRVPAHIELGFFSQAKSQRALVFRPTLARLGAKSRAGELEGPRGTSHLPGSLAVPLLAPEAISSLPQSLSVGTVLWHPRQPTC